MGEAVPGDTQITLYDETGEIVGTRFRSPTPEKITDPKTAKSMGELFVEGARGLFGETGVPRV